MARILSVQHWDYPFAYNNVAYFERHGDVVDTSRLFAGERLPDPSVYDLIIVYGGEMSAFDDNASPWLLRELRFLESCLDAKAPLLGICLGSQLIARALGAKVYKSERPEFGFKRLKLNSTGSADPVLGSLGVSNGRFLGLEWHDDAWDLPFGASLLAESEAWPNQAFRYGPSVLALQFHLEFTQPHMAWAVCRPNEPASADPQAEDRGSFAAPGPRYEELRGNMEIVLDGMLGRRHSPTKSHGAVARSSSAR